ncbi:MAG: glutathione S-transferase family protein [Polyangiales bacterium]
MSLILYESPLSSNAQKVRFLLAELELAYESREVAMFGVGTRSPEYLEINPFGLLPTLIDNDFVLTESNTILRYVAETKGGEELYPRSPRLRAGVDRMLDVLGCTMRPRVAPLERRRFANFPHGVRDEDDERKLEANVRLCLEGVEAILPPESLGGYACGPFSIADCSWAPTLRRLVDMQFDFSATPKVGAWAALLMERPAWHRSRGPDLEIRAFEP